MGTAYPNKYLLISAVAFFAVAAMDIAVPAFVLSAMAMLRWVVSPEIGPATIVKGAA